MSEKNLNYLMYSVASQNTGVSVIQTQICTGVSEIQTQTCTVCARRCQDTGQGRSCLHSILYNPIVYCTEILLVQWSTDIHTLHVLHALISKKLLPKVKELLVTPQ